MPALTLPASSGVADAAAEVAEMVQLAEAGSGFVLAGPPRGAAVEPLPFVLVLLLFCSPCFFLCFLILKHIYICI